MALDRLNVKKYSNFYNFSELICERTSGFRVRATQTLEAVRHVLVQAEHLAPQTGVAAGEPRKRRGPPRCMYKGALKNGVSCKDALKNGDLHEGALNNGVSYKGARKLCFI